MIGLLLLYGGSSYVIPLLGGPNILEPFTSFVLFFVTEPSAAIVGIWIALVF